MASEAIRSDISEALGRWQERLLDLTRRNRLLYFKPGSSVVHITEQEADRLLSDLSSSAKGLSFDYAERRRKPVSMAADSVESDSNALELNELEVVITPGDLTSDHSPLDLQKRLRGLQKRDIEWELEQGINVLFLSLGLLEWIDEDDSPAQAPLLMLPCKLGRTAPKEPFFLFREGDDPEVNPTLAYAMGQQGIELPEFDDESPSTFFARVREAVRRRPGWGVKEELYLATFSYSKLAMWKDLERLRTQGVAHSLVLQMAAHQNATSEVQQQDQDARPLPSHDELQGGRLDDLLASRDQFTVLSADFSQLQAIDAVRSGRNLVIHGPPGTGKSQTITNIIATLIAEGKSVLFVSEKRAALDVVKRNLEECELGVFCLDLHSEYGRRSVVYEQLKDSVAADRSCRPANPERLQELVQLREKLNTFVRAHHQLRNPLGRSAFEMAGEYAAVQQLPAVEVDVAWVSSLDPALYSRIQQITSRFARRRTEFLRHHTSPWAPLRSSEFQLGLSDDIRSAASRAETEVERLKAETQKVIAVFGIPPPPTAADVVRLKELCLHFETCPAIPSHWLSADRLQELTHEAEKAKLLCARREHLRKHTEDLFRSPGNLFDAEQIHDRLVAIPKDADALQLLLGADWERHIVSTAKHVVDTCRDLRGALQELFVIAGSLSKILGGYPVDSWIDLESAKKAASQISSLSPVPGEWVADQRTIHLEADRLRAVAEELTAQRRDLLEVFREEFIDVLDGTLATRYRNNCQTSLRYLKPQYWRDQRFIRGYARTPGRLPAENVLRAIDRTLEIQRLHRLWRNDERHGQKSFGARFRGLETDWRDLESALQTTGSLVSSWPGTPSTLTDLLTDASRAQALRGTHEAVGHCLKRIHYLLSRMDRQDLIQSTAGPRVLAGVLDQIIPHIETLAAATELLSGSADPKPATASELLATFAAAAHLVKLERDFESQSARLSATFGSRFRGFDTDWEEASDSIKWARHLLDLEPNAARHEWPRHAETPLSASTYRHWAELLQTNLSEILSVYFSAELSRWGNWANAPFVELIEWLAYIATRADEAADWLDYQRTCAELEAILGPGAPTKLRRVTDEATLVPKIVQRQVVRAWLEHTYRGEPVLRGFSITDHVTVQERFRQLDRQFPEAVREQVRRRCFGRYPQQSPSIDAGQVGALWHELSKKRRQLPVRKLFERLPTLLRQLKPCFLMSPLAVSQFLPLEEGMVDAVIFDEASQVFPEDAVPTVVRGKQVIVVGDRKQLPPTNFFRRADEEDLDEGEWDEEEDTFVGIESILDAMVGLVGRGQVGEQYLRVHYRSRSESLIQFSNHEFYSDRPLLVFPDPQPPQTVRALRDVYLPEGRYEPGKRINSIESEKVIDLIFEIMERSGDQQSIGVVALSRAQADFIQERLDVRREAARHLDICFSHDLREPFFVKNLENVQGDERDHIILSIGYGPLVEGGAAPNRFGPINREGGERRLNVAISRARKTMTVVHSLKPSHITSQARGAVLLKNYLDYVANPADFFARRVASRPSSEPESPFEEAVLSALRQRGHQVDAQVGVAGYRIDIGVLGEDSTRYVLGIECDGYRYHATPAARDRDWLRQSVLEGLGWTIHRVWSTAWIQNPTAELKRIETAIEGAKSDLDTAGGFQQVSDVPGTQEPLVNELVDHREIIVTPSGGSHAAQSAFVEYERAVLNDVTIEKLSDLQTAGMLTLRPFVERVVRVEMPVRADVVADRIREHWGFQRTGNTIWERVKAALTLAVRDDIVSWDETTPSGRIERRFLVIPGIAVRPRRPGMNDTARSIEFVSEGEIAAGVLAVAAAIHGGTRDELVVQTAREFGYRRTGENIDARIAPIVDRLMSAGRLRKSGDLLLPS